MGSVGGAAPGASATNEPPAAVANDIGKRERTQLAGRIVFVSERDGNREVYWMRPNGASVQRVTTDGADDYPAPQPPYAKQLLLLRASGEHQHDHAEQLFVAPWQGGDAAPLGRVGSRIRNPSWFPDGKRVVVEAAIDGFRDLYIVSLNGKVTRLTHDPKGSFEPSVSPNGAAIAFVSSRENDAEIYLLTMPSKQLSRLTWSRGDDSFPTFSPDGKTIAFVSMRAHTPRLHVMNVDGSKPRLLGGEVTAEHIEDRDLAFSPDGALIAMTRRRKGHAEVVVVRLKDGVIVATSGAHDIDEMPTWSPDGKYLAFSSDRSGDTELWIMRRDGSGAMAITHSPKPDWLPRWVAEPKN